MAIVAWRRRSSIDDARRQFEGILTIFLLDNLFYSVPLTMNLLHVIAT